ncbi:MAG: HpcH/HpaI aldolase/citrate lyase family protein [Ruminococcus bromii]|jgi:2-keto-3-deoxy-L-rhamnonate aldolase RhmA|uniref:aldolase/citrate lyase family protein n=1 Tax=Ruminococcus sp. YE282 TaxID=3158780 RepID=UPI00088F1C32|nr:HpcH/HpaI aldolase/citrate lyase family protein [Ruminococcus bromii]MDY4085444.1 aldolase/citrate lyase family protein [Ruminococcus bromii]MEE0963588.1 aldolase/citrate lyase family protein [Ruminococcus bromii]MEE3498114.1 aldolase/citrate lyase family protein [Ruminococcus bromii]SCY14593.1 HpcH/HpaI aldolase/citrate lyase family protein [Ruminococcus bromii]
MPLKLMYITNQPEVAKIAEVAGVDRIFVDMEYIGKADRQGGMDTVQSKHTVEDVQRIRESIHSSELLVRVNPIHGATQDYCSSKDEIDEVISRGADILMLPFFKKVEEVREFVKLVGGRAKTIPLVETPEAVENIDEILKINGIDEIFIGLNDLSLGYNKKFMFELLVDGTVENLCCKFRQKNIPFGFGGIASIGKGLLPSEYVIREHYRLGSTCSILSRSFCNVNNVKSLDKISDIFVNGIAEIRNFEKECEVHSKYFFDNLSDIRNIVKSVTDK